MTYDRHAVETWFETSRMSPLTGQQLASTHLIPNVFVRGQIARWRAKQEAARSRALAEAKAKAEAEAKAKAEAEAKAKAEALIFVLVGLILPLLWIFYRLRLGRAAQRLWQRRHGIRRHATRKLHLLVPLPLSWCAGTERAHQWFNAAQGHRRPKQQRWPRRVR